MIRCGPRIQTSPTAVIGRPRRDGRQLIVAGIAGLLRIEAGDQAEGGALVFPEQRQVGAPEPLGGQLDGLSAVENTLDEIRGQEGELQRPRDIADIRASRRAMSLMVRASAGSR